MATLPKGSKSKWAAVLLGFVAGLALLEIGLRVRVIGSRFDRIENRAPLRTTRWMEHPFLPYSGRPDETFVLFNDHLGINEEIRTNSFGFRSHELARSNHREDFFVACFGGSTTLGFATPTNGDTWPERLEAKLQARYPRRNVRVFNLGVDMATTAVSVVNFALIAAHFEPDLVIVYHGFNDLSALGAEDFRRDHAHRYRDLDPKSLFFGFARSLPEWVLSSYVATAVAGAVDFIAGVNDLERVAGRPRHDGPDRLHGIETTLGNLKTMHALAASYGGDALFSTFQFRDGAEPENAGFNAALREHFEAGDFVYVDQDALIPDRDPTLQVDECHFTAKGRELLAQNFSDAIIAAGFLEQTGSPIP